MKLATITAVVPLYNKSLSAIAALPVIARAGVGLVVCDNSDAKIDNAALAGQLGVDYLSMGGNVGLAVAYNRALDYIGDSSSYICLLDDDTTLPEDFFTRCLSALASSQASILAPLVIDERKILSPFIFKGLIPRRVRSLRELQGTSPQHLAAINSGLVISTALLQSLRFDERLFLDCVDMAFFKEARQFQPHIELLLDVQVRQRFAGNSPDRTALRQRFASWKQDMRSYAQGSLASRLVGELAIFRRWLNIQF